MSKTAVKSKKWLELQRIKKSVQQMILDDPEVSYGLDSPIELIADFDLELEEKYSALKFSQLVKDNYENTTSKLPVCFQQLLHFGVDLLKPEHKRNSTWQQFRLTNEMSCTKGCDSVLEAFGYRQSSTKDVYMFLNSPDKNKVAQVVIELSAGLIELQKFGNMKHKNPLHILELLTEGAKTVPASASAENAPLSKLTGLPVRVPAERSHPNYEGNLTKTSASSTAIREWLQKNRMKTVEELDNQVIEVAAGMYRNQALAEEELEYVLNHRRRCDAAQKLIDLMLKKDNENVYTCFWNQIRQTKQPDILLSPGVEGAEQCSVCGDGNNAERVLCSECDNKILCKECNLKWHSHMKRRHHRPQTIMPAPKSRDSSLHAVKLRDNADEINGFRNFSPSTDDLSQPSSSDDVSQPSTFYSSTGSLDPSDYLEDDMKELLSSIKPPPVAAAVSAGTQHSAINKLQAPGVFTLPNLNSSSATVAGSRRQHSNAAADEMSSLELKHEKKLKRAKETFEHETTPLQRYSPLSTALDQEQRRDNIVARKNETTPLQRYSPLSTASAQEPQTNLTAFVPKKEVTVERQSSYQSMFVKLQAEIFDDKTKTNENHRKQTSEKSLSEDQFENLSSSESEQHTPSSSKQHVASSLQQQQSESLDQRLASLEKSREEIDRKNKALAVVRAFQAAETQGLTEDELKDILSEARGLVNAVKYINDVWKPKVDSVVEQSRKIIDFNIDCRPESLARTCLHECGGDVERAVKLFITKWNEKVENIMKYCGLTSDENGRKVAVIELSNCHGDDEKALTALIRKKLGVNIYANEANEQNNSLSNEDVSNYTNEQLTKYLKDETQDIERRTRLILCEANLQGWTRAERVITLLNEIEGAQLTDVIEAARSQDTIEKCRLFLKRECECSVCYSMYPLTQMRSLPACQCRVCVDCVRGHFEVVIQERYIRNMVCPVCGLPDIDNSEQTEAYFDVLLLMFRDVLPSEVFELFQEKLRDWNLMMDPSFRWCAYTDCRCGFLVDAQLATQKKVKCPSCKKPMCQLCKKVWEDQHTSISCEEFQAWKEDNDPEIQAMGLARHLEENGIECPQCKCRYSLAKGGCMHFTCYQCRHEFCSGCMEDFKRGKKCKKFKDCAKAGLHCHHPRDCLFYLRDRDINELQKLLKDHNVAYDNDTHNNQTAERGHCTVMEQKQTQNGFKDEACGKAVTVYSVSLCDVHYREYLVGLINRHRIDPVEVMELRELQLLLEKNEKKVPPKKRAENDEQYLQRLRECVVKELPLTDRKRRRLAPAPKPVAKVAVQGDRPIDEIDYAMFALDTKRRHLIEAK